MIERFPKPEVLQTINTLFQSGGSAYDAHTLLHAIPRPVCIDYHHVLVSGNEPLISNPSSFRFLEAARLVGTPVIVTTGESWGGIYGELADLDLWHEEMVLMTMPNYLFLSERRSPEGTELIRSYMQQWATLGTLFEEWQFRGAPHTKKIAPLFGHPYTIPLIDDTPAATQNNPGVLGITVKPFYDQNDPNSEWLSLRTGVSLSDAIAQVAAHYYAL